MPDMTKPATAAEKEEAHKRQRAAVDAALAEAPARSTGSVTLGGKAMAYRVDAGFVPVRSAAFGETLGEPDAALFTAAYQLEGEGAANRPVCFAFNGGPGAASIFLHLGALGPKRVRVRDDGGMPAPPYRVEDNPLSWFEHFDLVFLDPPHTGYSLTASEEVRKKAFSVDGDAEMLCEAIRAWLTRHRRWGSAVYLCGESYGTTRAAIIAEKLCDQGVALAGLVLVSCAMDIQSLFFSPRNDLPYALYLPAFAGTAQYHGCLKGPHAESADAARSAALDFVHSDYLSALHRGSSLSDKERSRIARRVGELIGLAPEVVEHMNLRVRDDRYFQELLRERGQVLGRLDARVAGPLGLDRQREWEFDPSMDALSAPYTMAAMDYFRGTLGIGAAEGAIERVYVPMSLQAHKAWNWNRGEAQGNSFTCTSPDLARALRRLPHLSVFVASGQFDLGTPYSATDWSLDQLDIPAEVRSRITHRYYGAGHMMYTRDADIRQLKADVASWIGDLPH
ncbi:S10 family peptidase [Ideonella sp. YS5]|uniref:S10 family peptidase n=1 Tax=Ideonella sp. YS5 TaxID=3453714 RepID=UPI003EE9ED46